jgi:HEAT repeat protein
MPSRLSSLLVRDGLVGVKRMEKAFQRQVIYGGALDTILLEANLVPEDRLLQYLSLATGLPPATRAETNVFDAEAIKVCPAEVARQYRVVPLCFENDALRVLVHDPVEMSSLEELANDLDRAIQPMVVPEYRWHIVFARMFGRTADARYGKLAKHAEENAGASPIGRSRTVIVEEVQPEDTDEHVVVDVGLPPSAGPVVEPASRTSTMRLSTDALASHLAETEAARKQAQAARAGSVPGDLAEADTRPVSRRRGTADPELPPEERRTTEWKRAPVAAEPPAAAEAVPEPTPRQKTGATLDDTSPLPANQAREALAVADERDLIFALLLRALRSRTWYAGLLTVQGGAAIGRVAIAGDAIEREEISRVLIPLDVPSAFRNAVESASPYIGPIATGDDQIDRMITHLGGVVPPAAMLLPISLRNRVVALAVGHRGGDTLGAADVSELLPLSAVAAEALSRLIMKNKSVGYRPVSADAGAAPKVEAEDLPTRPVERDGGGWSAPASDESVPDVEFGTEVSLEAGDPDTIETVFDAVESSDAATSEAALEDALRRPDEAVRLLQERFPGPLVVDRYASGGRAARAAQHGPLLDLVTRLGAVTADLLYDKMRDPNREVRYYATLCAAELRPRSLVGALVERLFDTDYGTRQVALEALSGYPRRELDTNLVRARHALAATEPDRVQAAADALAELGDINAVPDLIDAVARGDKGSEHARRALTSLTKQNFGTSARKWRGWWNKNKTRHRIEWLIDGLGHKDESIRRSAVEDLRTLTGEYFGYNHDQARKERDAARQRWDTWWNETGRRRFLRHDRDERDRNTALLPARRD